MWWSAKCLHEAIMIILLFTQNNCIVSGCCFYWHTLNVYCFNDTNEFFMNESHLLMNWIACTFSTQNTLYSLTWMSKKIGSIVIVNENLMIHGLVTFTNVVLKEIPVTLCFEQSNKKKCFTWIKVNKIHSDWLMYRLNA